MARNHKETAKWVIDTLRSLGIEPNPSSRLMKMHQVLTGPNTSIPHGHPDFEIALEARRDMIVLDFILEQSHSMRDNDDFIRKLSIVCYDSVLPQTDRQESRGRNTQFELFVAAICQSAGLCPVTYEEPDVCCTLDSTLISIAAKRVKSESRIDQRVREAARQIRRVGHPGFVVLDTSIALNPENRRIETVIPNDKFGLQYSEAMNFSIASHANVWGYLKLQRGTIGCIVHDQQVRVDPDHDWSLTGMTTIVPTPTNAAESKVFDSFWDRYSNGLPNVQHLWR